MNFDSLISFFPDVLNEGKAASFRRYFELLVKANSIMNLTRISDTDEAIVKHFYDSLAPAHLLMPSPSLIDVGSGAGFPGLVYAIAYPAIKVSLVESSGKKCRFLHEVKDELGLQNVSIINARAEKLREREFYDAATARAVSELPVLLELLSPLVKVGGKILAYKGPDVSGELEKAERAIRLLGLELATVEESELPLAMGKRSNVLLRKARRCPRNFPRDYADIKRNPL